MTLGKFNDRGNIAATRSGWHSGRQTRRGLAHGEVDQGADGPDADPDDPAAVAADEQADTSRAESEAKLDEGKHEAQEDDA